MDEACAWTADHVHASRREADVVSSLQALEDDCMHT